ncbi:cytochrome C assembly protein, partial [Staphylococcus epidermidis]
LYGVYIFIRIKKWISQRNLIYFNII